MRILASLLLLPALLAADTIQVEPSADAVVVRSPLAEGNFLMRLPPGFARSEAKEPWNAILVKDKTTLRLRISQVGSDQSELGAGELARSRAGKLKLEGEGGARRIGTGPGELALFVRDGKRLYEIRVTGPDDEIKPLRAALENFTLLDPKGAPEPAPTDPAALKPVTLEHTFYKIRVLKPSGFAERPPDVDGDPGIWKHLRRIGEHGNRVEIFIRSHLSVKFPKSAEDLSIERMQRFQNRYKDVRSPKKAKSWKPRGAKEGRQVQMSARAPKTGQIVRADYRYVEHKNGRTYEIEMIMWGNTARAWKKDIRAFWKSLKISGG
ncbi:MAG: hypothetical protein AAGD14_07715 [Planctomycetota bacterium]